MKKIVIFFSSFLYLIGVAFAQGGPEGRYCGKVFHAGEMVSVVVVISKDNNDILVGKSYYDNNNKDKDTVILTMRETGRPTNTTINFLWEDVYGKGLASLVFSSDFTNFTGTWGTGLEKPAYPWVGKKCDDKTS